MLNSFGSMYFFFKFNYSHLLFYLAQAICGTLSSHLCSWESVLMRLLPDVTDAENGENMDVWSTVTVACSNSQHCSAMHIYTCLCLYIVRLIVALPLPLTIVTSDCGVKWSSRWKNDTQSSLYIRLQYTGVVSIKATYMFISVLWLLPTCTFGINFFLLTIQFSKCRCLYSE